MLPDKLRKYRIILASKSPRRQELLQQLGLKFDVKVFNTEENFPPDMPAENVPVFLAEQKAIPFAQTIENDMLVITADTIVHIDGEVLGKPTNFEDAFRMLKKLSGNWHIVTTGVCVTSATKKISFSSQTRVLFKELSDEEINYYIRTYEPYDKAGAYGIQEWIGFIAVERIEGSYFNVMGLPVQHLYEVLTDF